MTTTLRRAAAIGLLAGPLVVALPGAAHAEPEATPAARSTSNIEKVVKSTYVDTTFSADGNLVTTTVHNTSPHTLNCTSVLQYNATPLTQLSWNFFQIIPPGMAADFEIDAPLPGKYRERTICYPEGSGPLPGAPIPAEFLITLIFDSDTVITTAQPVTVTMRSFLGSSG